MAKAYHGFAKKSCVKEGAVAKNSKHNNKVSYLSRTKIKALKLTLPLAICFLVCLSACKKWQHQYPEDTEKTKLTPTERLTNKWWTLQRASVNGVDYTDSVAMLFGKYQIYFSRNIESTATNGITLYLGTVKTELEPSFTTVWRFRNEECISILDLNGNNSSKFSVVPGYVVASDLKYTILRLSDKELKFTLYWGNGYTITNSYLTQ